MKTSKIKAIHKCEGKETKFGLVYYHDIEMENGDRGSIGKKKENAFTVGQELDYTIEENDKHKGLFNIKEAQKEITQGGSSYQKEDPMVKNIGFALSYSKDLAVGDKIKVDDILHHADNFLAWMNAKHLELQTKQELQPVKEEEKKDQTKTSNPDTITADQLKQLKTLWNESGITDDVMRKFMAEDYKVSSSKDLTYENAKSFIKHLRDQAWVDVMVKQGQPQEPNKLDDDFPF